MKKIKSYTYITRQGSSGLELLTFIQPNDPDSGMQVPGGTVDEGESPQDAALREVKEEAGLSNLSVVAELGALDYFHKQKQEPQERHYFHLTPSAQPPHSWKHTVSSGSNDQGRLFEFFWLPLDQAYELAGRQGELAFTLSANPYAELSTIVKYLLRIGCKYMQQNLLPDDAVPEVCAIQGHGKNV